MRVLNVGGTSQPACRCGSWLDHWKRFSNQALPARCPVLSCKESPAVGTHVQKDVVFDNDWYIVPLCARHNRLTDETLDVSDGIAFVPADVSETCGKSTL